MKSMKGLKHNYTPWILFLATFLQASYANPTAPVSGFAHSFLSGKPIPDADITVLETGEHLKTDAQGKFGPIDYPIGRPLTLELTKPGFKTTQTGTVVVAPSGLTDRYHEITFQVPSNPIYYLFKFATGGEDNPNQCHVVTTVTDFHKTLADSPQGIEGATIVLSPPVKVKPFYFDIFNRFFKHKTNPFNRNLTQTSRDGGVLFFNLPPQKVPYELTAQKPGVSFTHVKFICRKGAFINLSPPGGPNLVYN